MTGKEISITEQCMTGKCAQAAETPTGGREEESRVAAGMPTGSREPSESAAAARRPEENGIAAEMLAGNGAKAERPVEDGIAAETLTGSVAAAKSRRGDKVALSRRLQMLADMVTPGNRLVDVGCDHGYLAISLVGSGICPRAIAMDVREGPLAAAKAHIAEYGLDEYIEVRLSDGLAECRYGEADTLVCAGMGGRLMERILREGMRKVREMRELILQPQSELPQFRLFLREAGFAVTDEDAVFEDGKYYFAMKSVYRQKVDEITNAKGENQVDTKGLSGGAGLQVEEADEVPVNGGNKNGGNRNGGNGSTGQEPGAAEETERWQRLCGLYGEILLQKRHPVLLQYLRQREIYVRNLEESLASAGTCKAGRRLEEVRRELEDIKAALTFYSGGV